MPLGTSYPFGLRDVKLTPFTNEVTEVLGTPLDLPASRVMSFTEAEDFQELRGDDKTITSRGTGAQVEWDLEAGGLSLEIYKILAGGTLASTGTTPSQVKKFTKKATDSRPFFKAEGQAMSDSGGDVHIVLYRCRCTGDLEGEFSDGNWFLTKCSGTAFPSQAVTTIDALYDIVHNETVVPIPAV